MAHSYKWVTIYAELLTITVWMEVPNSHLPLGSLKGWLLATGEGRWKSTAKPGLVSNRQGIWMHYLKAEVGGMVRTGAPCRSSQLTDSDKEWSYPTFWLGRDVLGSSVEH